MLAVSGATGLVGAHVVVEALKMGLPVRAITRKGSSILYTERLLKHYGVLEQSHTLLEWVQANPNNTEELAYALRKVTRLVHAAGFICFDNRFEKQLLKVNRDYTAHWVNAAVQEGVKHITYISSIAAIPNINLRKKNAYKWSDKSWRNAYGYSKYMGEMEVNRGGEEGLATFIIRPAICFGPVDKSHPLYRSLKWMETKIGVTTSGVLEIVDARHVAHAAMHPLNYESPLTLYTNQLSVKKLTIAGRKIWGNSKSVIVLGRLGIFLLAPLSNFIARIMEKEAPLPRNVVQALFLKKKPLVEAEDQLFTLRESLENCKRFLSIGR